MAAKHPTRTPRRGVDRAGRTPLHYAALERNSVEVGRLLASGADPGAIDDNGWTPLHFAAQAGASDVAASLIAAGAPVDARDRAGNTPLSTAVFNCTGQGEMISVLRSHGADPLAPNRYGVSPLSLARTIANYDVRRFFADLSEAPGA